MTHRRPASRTPGFPVADISEYLADDLATIWLDLRDPTATTSPC
jgi:hypothetical protein